MRAGSPYRLAWLSSIGAAWRAGRAHPLGNFSVNHLSTVSISADRVDVRYILDQAEIPTVQERGLGRAEVLRRKLDEIGRGLVLTVDGRRAELHAAGSPQLSFPAGRAGSTTRLELPRCRRSEPAASRCTTAPSPAGSAGRRSSPGPARAPRSARRRRPATRPTASARYPKGLLQSPLDNARPTFSVDAGRAAHWSLPKAKRSAATT